MELKLSLAKALNNRITITRLCVNRGSAAFILAVLLDVIGQVLQILGIFVPLKVIYLIGSGEVPAFLNNVLPGWSFELWVWSLTFATILLFVFSSAFSLVAQRVASRSGKRYVSNLELAGAELHSKDRRRIRQVFMSNFKLTTDFVISVSFFGLVMLVDLWFFALDGVILLLVFGFLGVIARLNLHYGMAKYLWNNKFDHLVTYTFMFGFIAFFVALVFVVLAGYSSGFLTILITLVLTRRMLQILERAIRRHRAVMRKPDIGWLLK